MSIWLIKKSLAASKLLFLYNFIAFFLSPSWFFVFTSILKNTSLSPLSEWPSKKQDYKMPCYRLALVQVTTTCRRNLEAPRWLSVLSKCNRFQRLSLAKLSHFSFFSSLWFSEYFFFSRGVFFTFVNIQAYLHPSKHPSIEIVLYHLFYRSHL